MNVSGAAAHHRDRRRRGGRRARHGALVAQRHARGQDGARGARRQQRRDGRGDRRDEAFGIADRDLQTAGIQIKPRYNYTNKPDGTQEAELVAYQVTNTLSVRIRDLVKTGEILDKAVSLGVNQGGSIVFTNDDPAAVITEARKKAVADAMAKARTLAEAAGVSSAGCWRSPTSPSPPPMPIEAKAFDMAAASRAGPGRRKRLPGAGQRDFRTEIAEHLDLTQSKSPGGEASGAFFEPACPVRTAALATLAWLTSARSGSSAHGRRSSARGRHTCGRRP